MMSYPYTLDRGGNARWFVDQHKDDVRYVPESKQWLVWDRKRWAEDTAGQTFRWAADVSETLYTASRDKLISNDEAGRLFGWARTSNDDRTVAGVLRMASTDPRIIAPAGRLDADPWLLNVENGTLDLRTGALRRHDPADLITKLAPVTYDPGAESSTWNRVLDEATNDDTDLQGFLRRAAGYTLAGVPRDEVFFFVHGPAGSGKSTLTEPLAAVLGDYAITAQVTTFLARTRSGSGASGDVARLSGVRMVLTGEPDQGERLAAGFIKGLTGGDTITARHLFKAEFQFRPQLTLWFVANDRPYVHPGDTGLWRRVLETPFVHQVPEDERDASVKHALLTDPEAQSAILAWAVQGCREWQRDGLQVPQVVRDASSQYQQAMNPLSEFIADECEFVPGAWTSSADLYQRYVLRYTGRSDAMLKQRTFTRHLASLPGVAKHDMTKGRGWDGIALMTADDPFVGIVEAS